MTREKAAKKLREALEDAHKVAKEIREASHAGNCLACDGSGEIWIWNRGPSNPARSNTERTVTCLVCAGYGVIDCFVENCKEASCT